MLNREGSEPGGNGTTGEQPVRIVLTGFRATGKSLVGSILANRLGYKFVDTDEELVAKVHASVADFVREHGWPAFRKQERELLERLIWMKHVVIATGGGAVMNKKEWKSLREGSLVVWLQADAPTIRQRLGDDPASHKQRPSLTGKGRMDEVEIMLAEREPDYRDGSDLAIDTTGISPEKIVHLIQKHLSVMQKG